MSKKFVPLIGTLIIIILLVVIKLPVIKQSKIYFNVGIKFNEPIKPIIEPEIIDTLQLITFGDSVYQYIVQMNIKHPEIVFNQAIIESGTFTSAIFKENNNLFGMKIPFKRPTTALGINRGHATYSSWQESVHDYALYQVWSCKNCNKQEYLRLLGSQYSETDSLIYINAIK